MKSERLRRYLGQAYQRDILRESVTITPMDATSDLIEEIKAEIARIDALRLGANLAQRDFASYQARRALAELLALVEKTGTFSPVEGRDVAAVTGTVPPPPPRTGALAVTETRDVAAIAGTRT